MIQMTKHSDTIWLLLEYELKDYYFLLKDYYIPVNHTGSSQDFKGRRKLEDGQAKL